MVPWLNSISHTALLSAAADSVRELLRLNPPQSFRSTQERFTDRSGASAGWGRRENGKKIQAVVSLPTGYEKEEKSKLVSDKDKLSL